MNSFFKYSLFIFCAISAHALFAQSDSTTDEMPLGADFISLVTVGDTNNPPNAVSGWGSVSTVYQIGEYDVTASQYCTFLNHVAASDPHGLYNPKMGGLVTNTSTTNITPPHSPFYHPVDTNAADPAVACIQRYGATDGLYSYKTIPGRENFPITYVSIFSAVRFCNWMANGQPTGPEGPSTTELGSYIIGNGIQMAQNPTWILPDLNMWYKAAYYNRNNGSYWYYPTVSNIAPGNSLDPTMPNNANYIVNNLFATTNTPLLTPVGTFQASPGPYRTYDMGGDVCQWVVLLNQQQYITAPIAMGCAWNSSTLGITFDNTPNPLEDASTADNRTGFRVVCLPPVPKPSYVDTAVDQVKQNPVNVSYSIMNGSFSWSLAEMLKYYLARDPNCAESLMTQALDRSQLVQGQLGGVITQLNAQRNLWNRTGQLLSGQSSDGAVATVGEEVTQVSLPQMGTALQTATRSLLEELAPFADVGVVEEAAIPLTAILGAAAVPVIVGTVAVAAFYYYDPLNGITTGGALAAHAVKDLWTFGKTVGQAMAWL